MPNNYQFLDANSSVLTASAIDIGGGVLSPAVQVGSSVLTVGGNSSVIAYQLAGSVLATSATPGNSSVMLLNGANVIGSVAVLQGTNPWNIQGSVSGTVDVSILGMLPAGTRVIGSVATLQGTNPWVIMGSVSGTVGSSIVGQLPAGTATLGSVVAYQGVPSWNVGGSVLAQQMGTRVTSVLNSIPSSLLTGIHGQRNDAIASALGGDLSWRPVATDSAGRPVTKPFAPEESRVEGYVSTTNTSITTLVAGAGAGLRNYITDIWIANTGAAATLVTFSSGGGASVLGYTIAPAGSGSNLQGLITPIRTGVNETFGIQAATPTSILYATVKGFKAP